jgi:hypothetical protein
MFRIPHCRSGRIIAPGQLVHISVAFKSENYIPRATFREEMGIEWKSFIGQEIGSGGFSWTAQFAGKVEMDLFDPSLHSRGYPTAKKALGKG